MQVTSYKLDSRIRYPKKHSTEGTLSLYTVTDGHASLTMVMDKRKYILDLPRADAHRLAHAILDALNGSSL